MSSSPLSAVQCQVSTVTRTSFCHLSSTASTHKAVLHGFSALFTKKGDISTLSLTLSWMPKASELAPVYKLSSACQSSAGKIQITDHCPECPAISGPCLPLSHSLCHTGFILKGPNCFPPHVLCTCYFPCWESLPPHLKRPHLITSEESLLPYKVTFGNIHRFQGLGCGHI